MSTKREKVLITGATGFLGQHLVDKIADMGSYVTGIFRSHEPQDESKKNISFLRCDLADREAVEKLFINNYYDTVVHLAGQMRGNKVIDYLNNTVRSTENLLSCSEKYGVKRFIQASSIAVYGYVNGEVDEKSDRINLDDYATAKYLCERLVSDATIPYRIALRLPRILGEGMDLSYPWIPKLIRKLLDNDDIVYFNPSLPYNNMAYVENVCEFIEKLRLCDREGYHLIGIASSDALTVKEIIDTLYEGLGSRSKMIETKNNIPRNTCHLIDYNRALEYGYKPNTVKETLEKTVADIKREYGIM